MITSVTVATTACAGCGGEDLTFVLKHIKGTVFLRLRCEGCGITSPDVEWGDGMFAEKIANARVILEWNEQQYTSHRTHGTCRGCCAARHAERTNNAV